MPLNYSYIEKYSDKCCRDNRIHILRSITFFKENRTVYKMMRKKCTAGHVTNENRAHAHCMPDS
jgi:hypothetical protein